MGSVSTFSNFINKLKSCTLYFFSCLHLSSALVKPEFPVEAMAQIWDLQSQVRDTSSSKPRAKTTTIHQTTQISFGRGAMARARTRARARTTTINQTMQILLGRGAMARARTRARARTTTINGKDYTMGKDYTN